jgi:hypothetical protein
MRIAQTTWMLQSLWTRIRLILDTLNRVVPECQPDSKTAILPESGVIVESSEISDMIGISKAFRDLAPSLTIDIKMFIGNLCKR